MRDVILLTPSAGSASLKIFKLRGQHGPTPAPGSRPYILLQQFFTIRPGFQAKPLQSVLSLALKTAVQATLGDVLFQPMPRGSLSLTSPSAFPRSSVGNCNISILCSSLSFSVSTLAIKKNVQNTHRRESNVLNSMFS
jgi:hypothetical protein